LDVLVDIGGERSDSYNVFGHASMATTGNGIYSYGTNTNLGSSVTDFVTSQSNYRSQTLYVIKTTPEQDKKIQNYLSQFKNKNQIGLSNNCAARTLDALYAAGIDPLGEMMKINPYMTPPSVMTPSDLGLALKLMPGVQSYTIPQNGAIPDFLSQFNK
jgi:hypothetical protein